MPFLHSHLPHCHHDSALPRYARTSSFPYISGIVPVVLSWVVSPVLAGLVSGILFIIIRTLVLRRKNSTAISYWALPVFVLVTIWINGNHSMGSSICLTVGFQLACLFGNPREPGGHKTPGGHRPNICTHLPPWPFVWCVLDTCSVDQHVCQRGLRLRPCPALSTQSHPLARHCFAAGDVQGYLLALLFHWPLPAHFNPAPSFLPQCSSSSPRVPRTWWRCPLTR